MPDPNLQPADPGFRFVYTERQDAWDGPRPAGPAVRPITHWGNVNGFTSAFLTPPGSAEPVAWVDLGDDTQGTRIVEPSNTQSDEELIQEYLAPPE